MGEGNPSERKIEARVESEAFEGDGVDVVAVSGCEHVSQPFEFAVEIVDRKAGHLDLEAVMGAEVTLTLAAQGGDARTVHGIVVEAARLPHAEHGHAVHRLVLAPRVARMGYVHNVKVHVSARPVAVIQRRLGLFGLGDPADVELRLVAEPGEKRLLVQYRETDLAFMSRLLEEQGIAWYVADDGERDKLVLTDHVTGFGRLDGEGPLRYRASGARHDVFELGYRRRLVPKTFVCRDYNYRTPHLDVQSERVSLDEGDLGGVFEYGTGCDTVEQATTHARRIAERHLAERDVYEGRSDLAAFSAGHTFALSEHPEELPRLLVVSVEHELRRPFQGTAGAVPYHNRFTAVPATRMYRPPCRTPVPRIHGLVHAVVQTDAAGTVAKNAQIDSEGRYLVKFRFDAQALEDNTDASCRVRMIQPSAGSGYGMQFPLRPGVEVLVAFIGGDPDCPVIVGAAPNPITPSPVATTSGSKNRIRTASGALIEMDDGS